MSRSFKKTPSCVVFHNKNYSNKFSRQQANRRMRRANKQIIQDNMSYQKEWYPDGPDLLDDFNNPLWYDWWEQWPIEELTDSDFKKLREVSDVWAFTTDGLARVIGKNQLVKDGSIPYCWENYLTHPKLTIAEAKRQHNWGTLKHYIRK